MSILASAVPLPQLTADQVAKLIEASQHMQAVIRILGELEEPLRVAEEIETAWWDANLTDGERNALSDLDFVTIGDLTMDIRGNSGASPEHFGQDLAAVAERSRPIKEGATR